MSLQGCLPNFKWTQQLMINSTSSRQNGRHFADNIYFQVHFHEWKVLYFDSNFTDICSKGSNWQSPSIGLDNGLAPNRRQAIIWTNANPIHWRIYAALGGDELIKHGTIPDSSPLYNHTLYLQYIFTAVNACMGYHHVSCPCKIFGMVILVLCVLGCEKRYCWSTGHIFSHNQLTL